MTNNTRIRAMSEDKVRELVEWIYHHKNHLRHMHKHLILCCTGRRDGNIYQNLQRSEMMDTYEKIMVGFGLGFAFMILMNMILLTNPQDIITACQKQHNVYRCEIVAVPVKGSDYE